MAKYNATNNNSLNLSREVPDYLPNNLSAHTWPNNLSAHTWPNNLSAHTWPNNLSAHTWPNANSFSQNLHTDGKSNLY